MHPQLRDLALFAVENATAAAHWLRDHPDNTTVAIVGAAIEAPLWACQRLQAAGTVPILRVLAAEESEVERLDRALRRSPFLYGDRACLPADADLATTIGDAARSTTPLPDTPAPTRQFEDSTLTLLEATPTATLVVDADDCVIGASPQARALLGRPARWLEGRPLAAAFVAADQPRLAAYLRHCSTKVELPASDVLHCRDEHGATRLVVLGGGLAQPGGHTGTKVLVVRDATSAEADASSARQVEAHGNEALLRAALDAAAVGTWYWDVATGEIQWSDNLEAIFGLTPGTFDGSFDAYLEYCVHEADRDAVLDTVQDALAGKPEYQVEHRYIDADGKVGWMDCRGRMEFDYAGEPRRMAGICMDISERNRAVQALATSEARQRFTLEAARVGTWNWDIATGNVHWSENLEAIHGMAPGSFAGDFSAFMEGVEPEHRERVRQTIDAALEAGGDFHIEYPETRPDGKLGWIEGRGRVEHDDTGTPTGINGISMDITSRKHAEELLRALADAGTTLATSLDYEKTLAQVADMVVPEWGDWCAIEVLERDRLETTAVAHVDPNKVERARELRRAYPPRMDAASGVGYVVRTGQPQCIPIIEEKDIRAVAVDERHLSMVQELGLRSAIIVPLIARGRTLGALTLVAAETNRSYRESDLPHIQELARRCAFAVDNARLYRAAEDELDHRIRTEIELKRLNETLEQRVAKRTAVAEHRAAQLRSLTAQLTQAEQRERRRLARNLHDDHQQILVAARLQLGRLRHGSLNKEGRKDAVDQLDDLLGEAIDSARTVSRELSPAVLYDGGLSAALYWLVPHKRDKYNLEMHVATDPEADPEAEEVAILLFQAVRELLFNVVKHAGTNEAWVRMSAADGDRVCIEVEDQGNGMDPDRMASEADNERFGLFGMRERLAHWDGELKLDSSPGHGTRVTLTVPRHVRGNASSTHGSPGSAPKPDDAPWLPPGAAPRGSGDSGTEAAREDFDERPDRSGQHGDRRPPRQR
jgi:PAS domain S-box-containing protein